MSTGNSGRGKKRSRAQANGNEEGAGTSSAPAPKTTKSNANNKLMSTSLKRQELCTFYVRFLLYIFKKQAFSLLIISSCCFDYSHVSRLVWHGKVLVLVK